MYINIVTHLKFTLYLGTFISCMGEQGILSIFHIVPMNTDMRFHSPLSWRNSYPWETYITGFNVAKYGSDICLGEQISLGKCVRGHTFPEGILITVTPAAIICEL